MVLGTGAPNNGTFTCVITLVDVTVVFTMVFVRLITLGAVVVVVVVVVEDICVVFLWFGFLRVQEIVEM